MIHFLNFNRLSLHLILIFKITHTILSQLHGFVLNYYVYYKIIHHQVRRTLLNIFQINCCCSVNEDDPSIRSRLNECLDTILNKAQEPLKSKKVQHSNARNAVLFEAINLIIHMDCESSLLVRACNQLGQFLQNRETNLRYLALESMCLLATSEFSHEAVKKHQETVINALKVTNKTIVTFELINFISERTRCQCSTTCCGSFICNVRSFECRRYCTRNVNVS
jgi:hypothetical protein